MIVIPIDLLPLGFTHNKRTLGKVVIINDGTGDRKTGNYDITIVGASDRAIRRGRVEGWPRQSRPVFELLLAALESCNYKPRKRK